jgi:hypothetical protein
MVTKGRRFLMAAGVIGVLIAGAGPAMAQHSGGGHGGGGGGHASGGGGHAAGGGGTHYAGGGAHFAPGGHYAGGAAYGHGYGGYPAAYHGGGYAGGHAAYGRPGGYYGGHGYSTGAYWRGGYWHGGFWPRAYYGYGFSWFLPILPLAYATYWYGGIPYYYANDVYYTWNPSYEGYVATDPPPVTDQSGAAAGDAGAAVAPTAAPMTAPGPSDAGGAAGQIFMYPKNGQSPEQQAKDKAECQQWASQQAGQVAQNGSDYQRAMAACVEGRGYSAR